MNDWDVVVIGAGVAGLAALQTLSQAGLRVIALEARDRIGGRIYTIHDPLSSLPLELGAEFVHGRPEELWDVIHDAELAVYDGTDESRYMNDGQVERNADAWELVNSVIDDMREAAKGPDQSFEQFLTGTKYDEETKRAARGYIEGFNAAEADVISIHALAEEIAAANEIDGDRVYRFSRGYNAVPWHLLRGFGRFRTKLRLNTVVGSVVWEPNSVSVNCRNVLTNQVQTWQARHAVITVPLGVLQADTISFSPAPTEILQAARDLRFGHVFRVVLRFRHAFWEQKEELRDAGFILSRETYFPTWWTTLATRSTLLTGWSAGAHAIGLLGMSKAAILDKAIKSLARIIGFETETIHDQLEAVYFHDWSQDPYALGGYSYVPVGALNARKQLAVPVQDTLYFAGEATDQNGHAATVHGAIASGRRAARQILSGTVMANR